MKTIQTLQPLQNIHQVFEKPTVFLAGSIEMDRAENWQARAETLLGDRYVLFNPRRDSWDNSWKQEIGNPQFKAQVDWELDALEKADHVLMYFAPGTQSPISLLELGLFASSKKMVVCCPEGFWRKGNVEIVCQRLDITFFDNFDQAVEYLMQKQWK